jgi:hypothetical protein
MLRVDCYETDGEPWLGELTRDRATGLAGLESEFDALAGPADPLGPRAGSRGRGSQEGQPVTATVSSGLTEGPVVAPPL